MSNPNLREQFRPLIRELKDLMAKFSRKRHSTDLKFVHDVIEQIDALAKVYEESGSLHAKGVWNKKYLKNLDIAQFRSDNAYLWQGRVHSEINFFVTYLYVQLIDEMRLLSILSENSDYGAETFQFSGKIFSRDLLDSIIELNFLDRHLNISKMTSLNLIDIGAGYGRLALRASQSLPRAKIKCVDAVPLSTVLSRHYLKTEISQGKIEVLDLTSIENIPIGSFDIAVNIHSFSEMSIESVEYWLNLLASTKVQYLFIVPNGSKLTLNDGTDFTPILNKVGYSVIVQENKYQDYDHSRFGAYPSSYFLLELHKS
jgi:hypothetical protein